MNFKESLPGIFSSQIEIKPPLLQNTSINSGIKARNQSFQAQAMPPNHSSRDRGLQLKVGTSRTRHGNR